MASLKSGDGVWQHILIGLLTLAPAGFIVSAALASWQRPCRTAIPSYPSGTTCPSILGDAIPLLVALGFWAVGVRLWRARVQGSTLAFFLVVPTVLATGKTGTISDEVVSRLFYLLLAWLAPLTFHLYRQISGRPLGRADRIVLVVLCGFAFAWSLPLLFWSTPNRRESSWFAVVRLGARLGFVVAFLLAAGWLFHDYRHRASAVMRRRIRLITFGTICAFTPMLLLSILPETLRAPTYVPYELTFLCLLLCPLTYSYALLGHETIKAEALLSRTAMVFLLVTFVLSVYLVAAAVLNHVAVDLSSQGLLPIGVLSAALLLLLSPLQRALGRLTDWVLYGSEIDYTAVVERFTNALSLTLDQQRLESLLVDQLPLALRLSGAGLILSNREGQFSLVAVRGLGRRDLAPLTVPQGGPLIACLAAAREPLNASQVRQVLADVPLAHEEETLLALPDIAFWAPLIAAERLQGVLIVGAKTDDDFFTGEDRRVLTILARQAGVAAHNVWLTEQIRAGQQELALAHQQLLVGREHEQRRLAREIHDGAVQQLLVVINRLARARRTLGAGQAPLAPPLDGAAGELEASHREALDVVSQLRGLIGELRPPGLDDLGLAAALEGYVERLDVAGGADTPEIDMDVDDALTLPEPVAICLFRVGQEALRNALRHADAAHVTLALHSSEERVMLSVIDDGWGFHVPARLTELAQTGHFGLVGIAERVAWLGGRLVVWSEPGAGTEVTVELPLDGATNDDANDPRRLGR